MSAEGENGIVGNEGNAVGGGVCEQGQWEKANVKKTWDFECLYVWERI